MGSQESKKGDPMSDELHGYFFEEIQIGMSASFAKTVTEADIMAFAGLSGDFNPVHINEEFASQTMFKGRIAHGMLSVGFISTVLGMKLPGPGCIYVNQSLKFKAPVRIGDTVTARVEVISTVPEKKFVVLKTSCTVAGKTVIDGEATLMVPSKS
jgi:3-hydroxybutyryl-CoA dehydratase